MRVCVVVKNSIWYDPRVKKQILSYLDNNVDLKCIGVKDPNYNEIEVSKLKCDIYLVPIDRKYYDVNRTFLKKIIRELKTNYRMLIEIAKCKPDIIHANDLNALIPAFIASLIRNTSIIYDTHEIFIENPWIANNKNVKRIWYFFENIMIKRVDLVVSVSNASAIFLSERYKIERPLVITNSIRKRRENVQVNTKSEKFEVLNHGQFYAGRGYELMIKAAEILREDKNIVFVLRGYGELEAEFRNEIARSFLENIRIDPPVKVDELISFASMSYIGIAITEPISINFELSVSNKLFEYAAAGLPVIMSDIPEHRFLNKKYNFGIILKELNAEELVNTIIKIYKDKNLYKVLSENATKLNDEVYWEKEFETLLRIEKSILERKLK